MAYNIPIPTTKGTDEMTNLSFEKSPQPISKENFRMEVELWESKGHKDVVTVEFDDDTGEIILIVRDYVMFEQSYFIRAKPWSFDSHIDDEETA